MTRPREASSSIHATARQRPRCTCALRSKASGVRTQAEPLQKVAELASRAQSEPWPDGVSAPNPRESIAQIEACACCADDGTQRRRDDIRRRATRAVQRHDVAGPIAPMRIRCSQTIPCRDTDGFEPWHPAKLIRQIAVEPRGGNGGTPACFTSCATRHPAIIQMLRAGVGAHTARKVCNLTLHIGGSDVRDSVNAMTST
jgi:hypothetical protein